MMYKMTTLQIAMTDEEYKYAKELLIKAQGSFQLDGNKYPMGKTIKEAQDIIGQFNKAMTENIDGEPVD